jgi:hypothetical protein
MAGLDTNTKLLFHMDGPDGSHEFIDDSNSEHSFAHTATAQLLTATKKWGKSSLSLDGDSDYISDADSTDWDIFNTTNFTLDVWIKLNSYSGSYYPIVTQYEDVSNRWHLYYDGRGGYNYLSFYGEDAPTWLNFNGGAISDTNWHHVALIKVGTDIGLYLDGTQTAYGDATSLVGSAFNGSLYIGYYVANPVYFPGYMDDFRITHTNSFSASPNATPDDTITVPTSAHTADVNTKLLLHLDTIDVSGDGGSGAYHCPAFYATTQLDTGNKKWGTASCQFDGDSDYITIPDSVDWDFWGSAVNNRTIDLWFQTDDTGQAAGTIMTQYEDSSNFWRMWFDNGTLHFGWKSGGSWKIDVYTGGVLLDTNWHHIALCRVANKTGMYLDGTQVLYGTTSDTDTFAAPLQIGTYNSSNYHQGRMDEIRFQNSNYFNADPNSTPDDTITVPTGPYSFGAKPFTQSIVVIA